MDQLENLGLSSSEEKFLKRFMRNVENKSIRYVTLIFLLIPSVIGFSEFIQDRKLDALYVAVTFAGLALIYFLFTRTYKKLYVILVKIIDKRNSESKQL